MFFIRVACGYGMRRYFLAYLVAIMVFLRKLIKNNLFSAPITEQNSLFFINITTRQQFFISVGESTKNMLKQRFANFFQIIFKVESMN